MDGPSSPAYPPAVSNDSQNHADRRALREKDAAEDGSDAALPGASLRLSRRRFLAGTGLTAATTAVLEACKPAAVGGAGGKGAEVAGPGQVSVTLQVNGKERTLSLEPRATLAEVLESEEWARQRARELVARGQGA